YSELNKIELEKLSLKWNILQTNRKILFLLLNEILIKINKYNNNNNNNNFIKLNKNNFNISILVESIVTEWSLYSLSSQKSINGLNNMKLIGYNFTQHKSIRNLIITVITSLGKILPDIIIDLIIPLFKFIQESN